MKTQTLALAPAICVLVLFSFPSFAIQNISTTQNLDITLSAADTININSGGILNGNINLGSSSSSALNLNSVGEINGNLTMGNSSQITTFNGGNLNGTINGLGKITVAENVVTNGNIGSSSSISSLTINASKTLNLATHNNSLTASGALNVGSGATLIVGTGSVAASIQGVADGVGTIKFNSNNALAGSVGTASSSLALVEIGSGATITTNTRNIDATLISIGNNATLSYGSGTITGGVEGQSSGVGSFVFNNTKTTGFTIGQNNILANIDVANGASVTLGGNIAANNINIGSGTSGKIRSNGKNISANNIKLSSGATLEIDAASTINGAINGNGIVQFSGLAAITQNNSLGDTLKLAQILISNETTLNINNNINFNADEIMIGEGSSGGIGIPTLNQNNGNLGVNSSSVIKLNSDSVFNYNGGTINGTVRGTSSDKGTFNINHDYTNNSEIGQSFDLANLNIASGKALNAGADISANNINLSGTLNLGNSAKTITGNLTTSGGAALIDLGSAKHILTGNFSSSFGDILKLTAQNNSNVGRIISSGNINLTSGINLQISFNSDDGYLSDGAKIAIVSGVSGVANSVSDSNIDVNNSSSNKSGIFTFRTESSGANLFLIVDRDDVSNFTSNEFAQKVYNAVDQAGSKATGNLRNLQKLIDNPNTSSITRESALKSIVPQSNQEINNSAMASAKSVVNVVNSRLDNVLFGSEKTHNSDDFFVSKNFNNSSKSFAKENIRENIRDLSHLNFEDEVFDSQSIWIQGFRTSATQDEVDDASGYDYQNYGLAIGVDQEIEKDLRLGVSASFSEGSVKSSSASQKQTDINSYQFNLYGGYVFDPYFVSAIVGMAINKYSALRSMPDLNSSAKADYDGQTYIAKFESGINKKFVSGFFAIPKASLVFAKNQVSTYSENGAGTLNLTVSNRHSNFLEARVGADFGYDDWKIDEFNFRPKIKLSYGYDLLAQEQSSKNSFQGQGNYFQIKNSSDDRGSLKYGFGFDLYEEDLILVNLEYNVESRASYESNTSSVYLRYRF